MGLGGNGRRCWIWSGLGGLQALKGHLEITRQPDVWAVYGPGEALEIVERIKQRAGGPLHLLLCKYRKALPGL